MGPGPSTWRYASATRLGSRFRALGRSSSFTTAVILESAALAIRGATFLVPGALGVEEGISLKPESALRVNAALEEPVLERTGHQTELRPLGQVLA